MSNQGGTICNDKEIREVITHAVAPHRFVQYHAGTHKIEPPSVDGQSGCFITDALEFMDEVVANTGGHYDVGAFAPVNRANDGLILLEAGGVVTDGEDITMAIDIDGYGGVGVSAATNVGHIYGKCRESATDGKTFLFEPRAMGQGVHI